MSKSLNLYGGVGVGLVATPARFATPGLSRELAIAVGREVFTALNRVELALLVGLFLIYNSVSFSVLQRRKLIGILLVTGPTGSGPSSVGASPGWNTRVSINPSASRPGNRSRVPSVDPSSTTKILFTYFNASLTTAPIVSSTS